MKIWREIAIPHQDVLKGVFSDSEFAADITRVHQGSAVPEYQDAKQFFSRTFITEGMGLLLDSLVRRLGGQGGDPIIQLQTAFGGGKTHTLLAVYHLAKQEYPFAELLGIPSIIDKAGIGELPPASVAVLDGTNLNPAVGKKHGSVHCRTLWGELAYQLAGEDGYGKVKDNDLSGTSPDKDQMISLLTSVSPCVILMDELVAFYREFNPGEKYMAGTFETNMTFIQVLTESIKAVPRAILLASLPDSGNAGENRGQVVLSELESYFRRLHKIWKPVSKEEAFGIVRRRLIERIEDEKEMEEVCRAFSTLYITNKQYLPPETQESEYIIRMKASYPIHPEIFDRLYEDWSTLPGFQRTRGVLQFLAQVIHRLWQDNNQDYMIMPGNIPLFDSQVRNKALDYIPQGWEPVIDQDIDSKQARTRSIEDSEPRFGTIQGARKAARTIFLGSAPGVGKKQALGLSDEHIFLGCIQPGEVIGIYQDVLKRLVDRLNYINVDGRLYWFGITPNLRREMESRKQRFAEASDLLPLVKKYLQKEFRKSDLFTGVHVFANSEDIPDDIGQGFRLVILDSKSHYRKGADETAFYGAEKILKYRGDKPREYQNRLIFLAPDMENQNRLMDTCRIYLAWESIINDIGLEKLVLDNIQIKNAKISRDKAEQHILRMVKETFKWLLCPTGVFKEGQFSQEWEVEGIPSPGMSSMRDMENFIVENKQWGTLKFGPQLLTKTLDRYYFKDSEEEVPAKRVWGDFARYLYMPRLQNEKVFTETLIAGIQSADYFGIALGKEGDKYRGFQFDSNGSFEMYDELLIIKRERASAYKQEMERKKTEETAPPIPPVGPDTIDGPFPDPTAPGDSSYPAEKVITSKKRFYGTIHLDPIKAKMDFANIVDEVVEHFSVLPTAKVTISIEIEAKDEHGFDEQLQRTVKENCGQLRFESFEFED